MPHFFAADIHLRLDRPERGERFARFVGTLRPSYPLSIVGDLCDFWYASRQSRLDPMLCPGLKSLAAFRDRGGRLTILAGNHDAWLGPLYIKTLGATFVENTSDQTVDGLRLHLAHGHRLGATGLLKRSMESRAFLKGFGAVPGFVADRLERRLEDSNERKRGADDRRHLAVYEKYANQAAPRYDLVVLGHLHRIVDRPPEAPRLVVPGSWHSGASFLRVDQGNARLVRE